MKHASKGGQYVEIKCSPLVRAFGRSDSPSPGSLGLGGDPRSDPPGSNRGGAHNS